MGLFERLSRTKQSSGASSGPSLREAAARDVVASTGVMVQMVGGPDDPSPRFPLAPAEVSEVQRLAHQARQGWADPDPVRSRQGFVVESLPTISGGVETLHVVRGFVIGAIGDARPLMARPRFEAPQLREFLVACAAARARLLPRDLNLDAPVPVEFTKPDPGYGITRVTAAAIRMALAAASAT